MLPFFFSQYSPFHGSKAFKAGVKPFWWKSNAWNYPTTITSYQLSMKTMTRTITTNKQRKQHIYAKKSEDSIENITNYKPNRSFNTKWMNKKKRRSDFSRRQIYNITMNNCQVRPDRAATNPQRRDTAVKICRSKKREWIQKWSEKYHPLFLSIN